MTASKLSRIHSIDFARGLVMVIMALDHCRDLLHIDSMTQSPTDLATTTPILFFTRWITHLCAPIFVFLSGVSAYLSLQQHGDVRESRRFLLSRGIWLILLECTVVSFGIWFDIYFRMLFFQVIAAIGCGFIVLALLIRVSPKWLGVAGLVIIFAHDLLSGVALPANPVARILGSILLARGVFPSPHFTFFVGYPVLPWTGILLTGYACGQLFIYAPDRRRRLFVRIGLGALLLFVLLRYTNIYGDPAPWSVQKNAVYSLLSFLNVSKYPPSLLYTLVTLGILFLLLAVTEGRHNRFISIFAVYGKVPLFYYLIHWYIVHSIMLVMVFAQGFPLSELVFGAFSFGRPKAGSGLTLPYVYLVWLGVIVLMYPLCRWYGQYKMAHKENKWLRYL